MKHYTNIIIFFLLLSTLCNSEIITTYDSRFNIKPVESSYLSVDVGITDVIKNPDYNQLYRSFVVPSLIDTQYKLAVEITGTVAQAESQLSALKAEQYPASTRFKNKNRRFEAKDIAEKSDSANSIPALRNEVRRLAELIESLLEDEARKQ